MIENNPSNVSSAFEMLLEEVEAEIDVALAPRFHFPGEELGIINGNIEYRVGVDGEDEE